MDRLIAQRRFNMTVLVLFGVLGLMIAAVGIYGVMAYIVAQRTGEIGIRMALGATRTSIVAMVLRRAGVLMVTGLALGGFVAWYGSAAVKAFLFEIEPNDARIFVGALLTLSIAGLFASFVPARRAASVDPLVALRRQWRLTVFCFRFSVCSFSAVTRSTKNYKPITTTKNLKPKTKN